MLNKNKIILAIVFVLGVIGVSALIVQSSPLPQQSPAIELACPTGATAIPQGVMLNPTNGKIRQLLCMDSSNNLLLPSNTGIGSGASTVLTVGVPGITSGSILIVGTGSGSTLSGVGQVLSWSGTAEAIPTTNFAGIGSVPAAGQIKFCTDCTTAATCAGAGSGHLAVSNGTNWTCQ